LASCNRSHFSRKIAFACQQLVQGNRDLASLLEQNSVIPPIVVQDEIATGQLWESDISLDLTESFYAVTMKRKFPNPLVGKLLAQDSL